MRLAFFYALFQCLLQVLQRQHSEVIALLGIAYELADSLSHLADECLWLGRCGFQHFLNPFLAKHLALGIFGLVQTIGIEEEGSAWCELLIKGGTRDDGKGTTAILGQAWRQWGVGV